MSREIFYQELTASGLPHMQDLSVLSDLEDLLLDSDDMRRGQDESLSSQDVSSHRYSGSSSYLLCVDFLFVDDVRDVQDLHGLEHLMLSLLCLDVPGRREWPDPITKQMRASE